MKNRTLAILLSLAGATLVATATPAAAYTRHVVHGNAEGGKTATTVVGREGPDGGAYGRARVTKTDGQGDVTTAGGSAFRGPNGAKGARAGKTTVNADGSATHASGFAASGSKGTVASQGSATRDASGNIDQSRTTTATSATTGNSVKATESYNSETGVTRSATCYNASGATIACPTRN
ncbi:MAG: hypothetical protein JSR18_00360 [Proteobacteria bacterium]|nr:hypothetical protein [Pseudomonadota bacterium]